MPKRKDGVDNIATVRIRMSKELMERCNAARKEGIHKEDAESSFIRFLIELGLNRYTKTILPLENGGNEKYAVEDRVTIHNEQGKPVAVSTGNPVLNRGRNVDEKKVVGD
jgi:hypothetical protein